MLRINILALTFVLMLSACSSTKAPIAGMDGAPIPPAFAHFPDVPFPKEAFLNLEETKALGSGNNWIGTLVYTTPYSASEVFDFYMSELPKMGWVEVATVRARISHLTYIKENRALQMLVESKSADDSIVTLTAIPNQAGIK